MYIVNGIAHAGKPMDEIAVLSVKPLDDLMMIVTFANGQQRLFDATPLLTMPAFAPLQEEAVFKDCKVEHGTVVWMDGDIDLAPETMYQQSYRYDHIEVS